MVSTAAAALSVFSWLQPFRTAPTSAQTEIQRLRTELLQQQQRADADRLELQLEVSAVARILACRS